MTDINTSNWTTRDADNTAPAPNGIQDSYPANAVTGVIQAVRGAVKREYVTTNPTVTSTGAGGAYAVTFDLMPTLEKGKKISFWSNQQNPSTASLNINTQGAIAITDSLGTPLTGGEIKNGQATEVIYDGAKFRLSSFNTVSPNFTGNASVQNLAASGNITSSGNISGNLNATQLTTGTVPSARIAGSYTGFTSIRMNEIQLRNGTRQTTILPAVEGLSLVNNSATGGETKLLLNSSGGDDSLTFTVGTGTAKLVFHEGNLTPARLNTQFGYTPANSTTNLTAGNGLTGGGTIAAARSFVLGTPSTITNATTNSVTATSHTHALTLTAADIVSILGYDPTPVGSVLTMSGSAAVPGYLLANGAAVTTAYPALRAYYLAISGWPKDASGNPLLPDYRGYFLRGWGTGQTVDAGRVFGSTQLDAFQGHKTRISGFADTTFGGSGATGLRNSPGNNFDGTTLVSDGVNGTPRTADETRPVNKTVSYWIKT